MTGYIAWIHRFDRRRTGANMKIFRPGRDSKLSVDRTLRLVVLQFHSCCRRSIILKDLPFIVNSVHRYSLLDLLLRKTIPTFLLVWTYLRMYITDFPLNRKETFAPVGRLILNASHPEYSLFTKLPDLSLNLRSRIRVRSRVTCAQESWINSHVVDALISIQAF